jgi:GT2 family glycosyltransferase
MQEMDRQQDADLQLSVVTVTWNAKKYVDECLSSLNQIEDLPCEIIVIDNASTDGTPDLIAEKFPSFQLIRSDRNLGFAKANNIGIRNSGGKYFCLVNSDVVVPKGCLTALIGFLESNPEVGVVGPQMLGPQGNIRRSAMRFPSLLSSVARSLSLDRSPWLSRIVHAQMMTDFSHDRQAEVDILNGWFWMIRREALSQVGLLDEQFFIYGEDMDWCLRFRKAGWKIVFFPGVSAIHYGGASSSAAPVRFYVEQQKADFQYWTKHHSAIAAWAYRAIIFTHNCLRFAGYAVIYCLSRGKRTEARSKLRRSWALVSWMAGLRSDLPGTERASAPPLGAA